MPDARRVGRPTKITKKRIATICSYIRMGSYVETAAEAAGICKQSLHTWQNRGNDVLERMECGEKIDDPEDKLYAAFVLQMNRAVAQSEVNDLKNINKAAAEGIWQAAAWRLERRHPERWAKQEQLVINNVDADTYIEQQYQTLAVLAGGREEEIGAAPESANRILEAVAGTAGAEAENPDPMGQSPTVAEASPVSEP